MHMFASPLEFEPFQRKNLIFFAMNSQSLKKLTFNKSLWNEQVTKSIDERPEAPQG